MKNFILAKNQVAPAFVGLLSLSGVIGFWLSQSPGAVAAPAGQICEVPNDQTRATSYIEAKAKAYPSFVTRPADFYNIVLAKMGACPTSATLKPGIKNCTSRLINYSKIQLSRINDAATTHMMGFDV